MISVFLACLLATTSPQEEIDAPFLLKPGDEAPATGILLPEKLAIRQAQRLVACETERDELKIAMSKSDRHGWFLAYFITAIVAFAAGMATTLLVK